MSINGRFRKLLDFCEKEDLKILHVSIRNDTALVKNKHGLKVLMYRKGEWK